jgi:hypothetical protein
MLLSPNETIFVAHRRLFEKDSVRFFVGRVDEYDAGIVRATGHTYVRDNMSGAMLEKAESRTKLFSVASGTLIFYVLPSHVHIADLRFVDDEGRLSLLDGQGFSMNLSDSARGGQV